MKPRIVSRLSPNEEASLLRRKQEERRRARLLQVREQEKAFARRVRGEVQERREEERRVLDEHLQATLEASHRAELRELEEKYLSRAGKIGQGHRNARAISEDENRLQELRILLAAKQRQRAQDRHRAAMKELTSNQLSDEKAGQRLVKARQQAREGEWERARQLTSKPRPAASLIMDLAVGKGQRVRLKEVEGYASTHYHIPGSMVERAATPELSGPTAQEMAQSVMEQECRLERNSAAAQHEQQEKARLRHKHALAQVRLEREKEEVLEQLKVLERRDREHRQRALAGMPANVFQPVQRRAEMVGEQQRDMEEAFEKLFVRTHGIGLDTNCVLAGIANSSSSKPSEDGSLLTDEETSSSAAYTPPHPEQKRLESSPGPHHPRSGHLSPIPEESLENDQGSPTTEAQKDSPTPAMFVKVPTAGVSRRHLSYNHPSDLSFSDVTPSELASAYDSSKTTTSSLSTREHHPPLPDPPGLRRRELHVGQSQPQSVHPTEKSHSRVESEHPQPPQTTAAASSSTTGGMQRLVSMIRSQQQAWNERMAARARLLPSALSPDSSSSPSPSQPPSLSVHTLSSSGRSTALSSVDERAHGSTGVPVHENEPQQTLPSLVHGFDMASDHSSLYSQGAGTALEERYRELREVADQRWPPIPSYAHPHVQEEAPFQSVESPPHLSAPRIETPSDKEEMRASNQPDPLSFTTLDSSLPLTTMASDGTNQLVENISAKAFPVEVSRHQSSHSAVAVSQEACDTLPVHPLPLFHRASPSSLESFSSETLRQQTGALDFEAINISTTVEHGSVSSDNEHLYHLDTEPRSSSTADITAYWPLPETGTVSSQLPPVPSEAVQSLSPHSSPDGDFTHSRREQSLSPHSDQDGGFTHSRREQSLSPNSNPDGGFTHPAREQSLSPHSDQDGGFTHPYREQVLFSLHSSPDYGGLTYSEREQSVSPHSDPGGCSTYPGKEQGGDYDSSVDRQTGSHNKPPLFNLRQSGAATHPTTSSNLSLQEMFLLKKQSFIQRSQSRVQQMEANARERFIKEAQKTDRPTHNTPRSSAHPRVASKSHTWGMSRAEPTPSAAEGDSQATTTSRKRRAVSFSSPLLHTQHSGIYTPPVIHRTDKPLRTPPALTSQRSRISKKEMKDRNSRFHSRLPEVRERRKEEKRRSEYAANREKARQFQERIRNKLKQGKTLVNLTRGKASLKHERPFKT